MSNVAGTLTVPGGVSQGNVTRTLAVNKRFNNVEQTCPGGYSGDPIAAGTYQADTQEAADALAAADLVCVAAGWADLAANGPIYDVAEQANGKIIVVGNFTQIGGETHNRIARINADGTIDSAFTTSITQSGGWVSSYGVHSVAIQTDQKIVVCGRFNAVNGTTRYAIARINTDGTTDTGFDAGTTDSSALAIGRVVIDSSGNLLFGGDIASQVQSTDVGLALRLDSTGTIDSTYVTNTETPGTSLIGTGDIALDSGDQVFVCGRHTQSGDSGTLRRSVSLLDVDGLILWSISHTFSPDIDPLIYSAKAMADGGVMVGGLFSAFGGEVRTNIVEIEAGGTIGSFAVAANSTVSAIELGASSTIYFGGSFTQLGGATHTRIGKASLAGSVDAGFTASADGAVEVIRLLSTGNLIVGGSFADFNGETRGKIAHITAAGVLA
jgi:uncharacterized delta-60 repeat protein